METVLRNPYQIELDTIIATQNPDGTNVLVRLADTILPDYHALKLFPEMVYCNDVLLPTEAVRDGKTLLLPDTPEQKVLRLRVSYAMRKHLLQQVTTRLILTVLCQNYFACTPIFFAHPTSDRIVRLTLPAMIDDEAASETARFLANRVNAWKDAGLNLHTRAERMETTFYGMATLPWMGPHLFHTAELDAITPHRSLCTSVGLQLEFLMGCDRPVF